jgi:transposase-like protein
MNWPATPVEYWSDFPPTFCPWRDCPEHRRGVPGYRFWRHGSYSTDRRRRIPRFLCLRCRKTFSRQTFSLTYYRKRPELLRHVAAGLVGGSALRQIARTLDCAPNTVARISARLGRHAMLLHARSLRELRGKLKEAVALDHFETFEFTQDYPFGVATPVGARSWFVYGLDPAPHRRAGKRSPAQSRRLRSRPGRALHGRYLGSTERVLDGLFRLVPAGERLALDTDDHPDYSRAVLRHPQRKRIRQRTYRNPPRGPKGTPRSAEAVARDRALFPVDLLHKILRHTLSHHRRETIAFARRLNAAMERLFVTVIWRNFVKRRSERKPDSTTPAVELDLATERWSWKRVLSRRLFFDREELLTPWPRLYRRGWSTPLLASNATHALIRNF